MGGHEGVGKVVKLGADTESSNLKIGDRVGVKWVSSACGHCRTIPFTFLNNPNIHLELNNPPSRTLPSQLRRTVLQLESLRLLHPRNIPAIHTRTRKLHNPYPRRSRLRLGSTTALRRRNSILRTETQQRAARTVGDNLRCRRRARPPRSTAREPGNRPARNQHRLRQQRGTRQGIWGRAFRGYHAVPEGR